MHAHKCGKCGCLFFHSNEMKGNAAAHRCPICGESQWAQFQPENAKLPRFESALTSPATPGFSVNDALETVAWALLVFSAGCIAYQAIKNIRAAGVSA